MVKYPGGGRGGTWSFNLTGAFNAAELVVQHAINQLFQMEKEVDIKLDRSGLWITETVTIVNSSHDTNPNNEVNDVTDSSRTF